MPYLSVEIFTHEGNLRRFDSFMRVACPSNLFDIDKIQTIALKFFCGNFEITRNGIGKGYEFGASLGAFILEPPEVVFCLICDELEAEGWNFHSRSSTGNTTHKFIFHQKT
jgi:hypothetical protein